MKNRFQSFDCSIAGKVVGITLRHGGGLQEPPHVYVRCDERDCQHVDLNHDPCPLRVEMFTDGSDTLVTDYLAQHAGSRICYACLTETLGVNHEQVRRASWRLKEAEGFFIRPSRCALCHRRRVTIGLPRGAGAPAPVRVPQMSGADAERDGAQHGDPSVPALGAYLHGRAGFAFCAHCLARELRVEPALVRDAMWTLEPQPGFDVRTAQCVNCLLSKRVIRYEEVTSEADPCRRIIEFLLQNSGVAFCGSCVAFSTDLPLFEARRLLTGLDGVDEFVRCDSACSACGRWQSVIGARKDAELPPRADDLGDVASGRVRYRGFRIDLLSFLTPEGWRPFALVKTVGGAMAPDVPPIVLGVLPTKFEADELAAAQARGWVDKGGP